MGFWERTWRERSDVIQLAYGDTWPPETVTPFSWSDRIRCPGACALSLPPIDGSRDPRRHRRDDWLYLSLGLSQPIDEKQRETERAAGKRYSAFGMEIALITQAKSEWPKRALYNFMTYFTDGEIINWGDRFPFGFYTLPDGSSTIYTGNPANSNIIPTGKIRAVLFWPFIFPDWQFVTSTGQFIVMVATGITEVEWELAKSTTTAHVVLLLCRSGIAQRTIPDRQCLLDDPRWQAEWEAITTLSPQECEAEIEAGIGRWHVARDAS